MLSKFAAISVRDENSAYIVKQLLGYAPEIHMDPVLMYDFTQEIAENKTDEKRLHYFICIYREIK